MNPLLWLSILLLCPLTYAALFLSPLPQLPFPSCPTITSCRTTGTLSANQVGASYLLPASTEQTVAVGELAALSNYGTGCNGFLVTASDLIDRTLVKSHFFETAVDNGSPVQTAAWTGFGGLLFCPSSEGVLLLEVDRRINITWYLLPPVINQTYSGQLALTMKTSLSIPSPSGVTILVKVSGYRPRFSIPSLFESNSLDGRETIAIFSEGFSVSLNLSAVRNIENVYRARIESEIPTIITVYPLTNARGGLTPVPYWGQLLCPTGANWVRLIPSGADSAVALNSNFSCSQPQIAIGSTKYNVSLGVYPLALDYTAQLRNLMGSDLSSDFVSVFGLYTLPKNPCYQNFSISVVSPASSTGAYGAEDYSVCQAMIRWPCSYDSDCSGPYGASAICSQATGTCSFSIGQIINCSILRMSSGRLQSYGGTSNLTNYFISKYSLSTLGRYNPPTYYKLDSSCLDGYGNLASLYLSGTTRCERRLVPYGTYGTYGTYGAYGTPNKSRRCYDQVCAPITPGSACIYPNGEGSAISASCNPHCSLGGPTFTLANCQLITNYLNTTCLNDNIIVSVTPPCNGAFGMTSCISGTEVYFGVTNYSAFSCADYTSSSVVSAVTPTVNAPVGSYIPPRYVFPQPLINNTYVSYDLLSLFDWDGFFTEVTAEAPGTVEKLITTNTNNYYLPLVFSDPNPMVNDQNRYWLYSGSGTLVLPGFNLSLPATASTNEFTVYVSPSLTVIEVVGTNILVCSKTATCNAISFSGSIILDSNGREIPVGALIQLTGRGICSSVGANNGLWQALLPSGTNYTLNSSLVYNSSLLVYGTLYTGSNTLTVTGNLYLLPGSALSIGQSGATVVKGDMVLEGGQLRIEGGNLNVTGCLNLTNGSLASTKENTTIYYSGCVEGSIGQVITPCYNAEFYQKSIVIYFDASLCTPDAPSSIIGDSYALIGGVTAAVIVAITVLIIVLFLKVDSLRRLVTPHHFRQRHVFAAQRPPRKPER